jgi:polysaccharide export outer membrane protein
MKSVSRILAVLFFVATIFACVSPKQIVNFREDKDEDAAFASAISDSHYVAIIQPFDLLNIYVSSASSEASSYFNFSERPEDQNSLANSYLVDVRGYIRLPLVGDIAVAGLTSIQARDTVTQKLKKYLINPSVKLTIRNFRVTVLGEVTRPGVVTVQNERITLTEALAMCGDLTVYSRRDNVLIIREEDGGKSYGQVDLNSRELFTSEYYYLHANDIIYIEPLKTKKAMAENWYRILPIIFSGISLMLAALAVVK